MQIPEEVATEILSKLPVKSLVRFICLSKYWASSFQTSHFITKHHLNNLNNKNLNLLLKHAHVETLDDSITYFSALSTENNNFEIVENIQLSMSKDFLLDAEIDGPCNGLLCLSDRGRGGVALWNPSTREFKVIPKSTVPRPFSDPYFSDPYFGCLGFGYDSDTNDYKIIRVVHNSNEPVEDDEEGPVVLIDITQVDLYSLKSDSWKEISPPKESLSGSPLYNKYINGCYYWRANRYSQSLVLSFDFANEKFSTFTLPNQVDGFFNLLEFNGLLGTFAYRTPSKSLDLWVMKFNIDGSCSWTIQFSIEPFPGVGRPLGFWKNDEIFLESLNHELVLFDPATKEVKNLGIDANKTTMRLIAYAESLVPINGRSEQEEHIIHLPPGHGLKHH